MQRAIQSGIPTVPPRFRHPAPAWTADLFRRIVILLWGWVALGLHGETIFAPTDTPWKYFKGLSEASAPDRTAWRQVAFDDTSWSEGRTPFYYSTAAAEPPFHVDGGPAGTVLADMRLNYSCVFLRKKFVIADPQALQALSFLAAIDDGFIAWINGVEIARNNVEAVEAPFNDFAQSPVPEPPPLDTYETPNPRALLVQGVNLLAVQAFNRSLDSSDFGFMAGLESAVDAEPPSVQAVNPAPNALVHSLTEIEVRFSEPVTHVDAADLLVNGKPASKLTVLSPLVYQFRFSEPSKGPVNIEWAQAHGVLDLALNPFVGLGWSYQLDPNVETGSARITEFMAANSKGLRDEDGDPSDWIEVSNLGSSPLALDGWFLTDDFKNLKKWRFPATNLAANAEMVLFASAKNRTVPGPALHTNFRLAAEGGQLALVRPDGTTIVSRFVYPEQRLDVSFGVGRGFREAPLVSVGSPVQVLIPTDDQLAYTWTGGDEPFNDRAWLTATNGVGFDPSTNLTPVGSFFIGAFGNAWGYRGLVDDFAVWDQALAADPIRALAAGATPLGIDNLRSLIRTDLDAVMRGRNASAYIRAPFVLQDGTNFDLLILRLNYDDGIVCWINGVEVARRNAPESLAFNSAATSERTNDQVRQAEALDLSRFKSSLHPGMNILAIQGLNSSAGDTEFLISAELLTGASTGNQYFTQPTPGAPNGVGITGFVGDVHSDPDRGFYFAPMDVRLWIETPGALLVYTTNGDVPALTNGVVVAGTNTVVHITTTTLLRASAFKDGYQPGGVSTRSYIYPPDVATQTRPSGVGPTWPGNYPADFSMDPRVLSRAAPGYGLTNALLDIPTVNLVLPPRNLWDAKSGIYANPLLETERAGSIELLQPGEQPGFQEDGGISIRGYSSELKSLTPKHSFNLVFRGKYGATKLKYRLFGDTSIDEFNGLVLRANVLDSWANSEIDFNHSIDGELRWYRTRASYVRDQWMRDTQLAQGQPASHGRFVHTYLNGLYWGLYNLDERIDEQFAAQHLGGKADEYDVVADGELKGGNSNAWNQLMALAGANLSGPANYQRLMGNNADGTRNLNYPILLDLTNLVDYMLLHIFAGADDWPWHNWVVVRRRTADSTGFKFLAWDQEISVNSLRKQHTDSGQLYAEVDAGGSPAFVYSRCRANAEFRQFFADRVQHHLFDHGALSVERNIARYDARVTEIDRAIVAESARWGDFYRPAKPYLREAEWLGTNQWMRAVFFPSNHMIALKRFRDARLFPSLAAPAFSQTGGFVPAGFALSLTNPNAAGTLYYTTDGTDPRLVGGAVAPGANSYTPPLTLNPPLMVRARVLDGSQWSPRVDAQFHLPQDFSRLLLTEIMYHPPPDGATDAEQLEFIELANVGDGPLNLSGLTFTAGIEFTFPAGTQILPGQFLVLARDRDAMTRRYPGFAVAGVYSGKLDNAGETLTLTDALGADIFSVTYADAAPWPASADGAGHSLQRVDAIGPANNPGHWQAAQPTPGGPALIADSDGDGLPDWWELANATGRLVPDADADPDQDGSPNRAEYLAGTNPRDPADVLRLQATGTPSNGGSVDLLLSFSGKAGRTYTIHSCDTLAPPVWERFVSVVSSTDRWITVTNLLPNGTPSRFFRVTTP